MRNVFITEAGKTKPNHVKIFKFMRHNTPLNLEEDSYFARIPFMSQQSTKNVYYSNGKSACNEMMFCPVHKNYYTELDGFLDKTNVVVSGNVGTFELFDDNHNSLLCFKVAIKK